MKTRRHLIALFLIAAWSASAVARAQPVASAFTYQGRIAGAAGPLGGDCDASFELWDDPVAGTRIGPVLDRRLSLRDGLFDTVLDFGAAVFDGGARYLQVTVACPSGAGTPEVLPRQALTPVPYALSVPWSGLTGVPEGFADGVDDDALGALDCPTDRVPRWNGASWICSDAVRSLAAEVGSGLTANGAPDVTLGRDPSLLQTRVAAVCPPQSSIRAVGEDGSVVCQPWGGGDITAVIAGLGLAGGADSGVATVGIDDAVTQRRIAAGCPPGQSIRAVAQDGSVTCELDNVAASGSLQVALATCSESGAGIQACTAACPAGFLVTGGGCSVTGTNLITQSSIVGNGWRCRCFAASGTLTCAATATCSRILP